MSSFRENLSDLLGRYPFDDGFIEKVRQRVIKECSKVPVHIHKRTQAQNRLELAAREAIVLHFDETFVDAWFPFTLRQGWPVAHCIIGKTKGGADTARIEFSFGPETDGHRGGQEIEPVEFPVMRQKPNILSKALQAFNKRDQKAERQPEPAPIGTPDGRPELKLNRPVDGKQALAANSSKNANAHKVETRSTTSPNSTTTLRATARKATLPRR